MTWNGWRVAWHRCVDLHNPRPLPLRHRRSALSDPNGWTLDSAEACKNPYALASVQFIYLFFSVDLLPAFNAAFIPWWKLHVACYEKTTKQNQRYVLSRFFFSCHLDCWCIRGKCPFIYQGRALHPPIYKFNSPSKLGLITTALGHNQHPWSNQGPALDRKGYFHK